MGKNISFIVLVLFLGFFYSCTLIQKSRDTNNDKLEHLADWMTGSFSSENQSLQDSNFYNIHLEMVRIWPERNDGIWLYVEQAAAWALDKPYRQRVYHLTKEANSYKSAVLTFKNPLRFAGSYENENVLSSLTVDSLTEKSGCHITLDYNGESFTGSTPEKACPSELRGANYATSEVTINKNELKSWDRGFNQKGEQVWGAVTGPYIFVRSNKK